VRGGGSKPRPVWETLAERFFMNIKFVPVRKED